MQLRLLSLLTGENTADSIEVVKSPLLMGMSIVTEVVQRLLLLQIWVATCERIPQSVLHGRISRVEVAIGVCLNLRVWVCLSRVFT